MCYCGRSQVSGWGGPALWRLGPGPRTGTAIPLGPFLQITPAAVAQVHLTPDVVNKNGKEKKREHPPSLIPFGKSPGCQVPYIMPAQADTCAGAGAGSGSGGDSGLIGWLRSTRTKRQRGRGTNSGLKGGALVREGWWGLDLEWEASEWLPVPWGYEKSKPRFGGSRVLSPDIRRPSLGWAS